MVEPRIRVVIADDDRAMRDALADLISSQSELELVGEAVNHDDVIRLAARDRPRVVVLDIRMPGGTAPATIKAIQDRSPTTAVIVLSAYENASNAIEVLAAGASAYLVKGSRDEELLEAIARAARGQLSMSAALARECVFLLRRELENERRSGAVALQNANLLRQLLDRVEAAVVLVAADGSIELVNARAARLFGYRRTELIDLPVTTLVPTSKYGEPADELLHRLVRREPPDEEPAVHFTATGRRKDGTTFPVEVSATPMPHGQRGVAVFLRDVSELSLTEARFRRLFEAFPDATVLVDTDGTIQLVNAAAEQLFGYAREDLVGQEVDVLLPEHPVTIYRREADDTRGAQDLTPVSMELTARRRDGSDFPVSVSIGRIRTDEGVQVILAMRDMTEMAGSRAALERSVETLRAAGQSHRNVLVDLVGAQERERWRIAAGIHDDSLQVITAAALRLQQLRRRLSDPEDLRVLAKLEETIRLAADRLRRLIFDFRPPALEHEGLVAAIKAYLEQLQTETGIECHLDNRLEEEPPRQTRVLIYRIAQDALMNVRKHARARRVDVRLVGVEGGTLVEITDDGVGFDVRSVEGRPGHLGLTLMRDRADIVGGWCRIESAPGAGTTVEFWIPHEGGLRRGGEE
ncbi:PAS domain S-box protein [Thermasporomyces composti]|jgi:PAS domain S-box-containing protein|uniref:histidine kinase n=1 Tax=Thermasporomyces composti TaxID=696763 RepID=A0A3D9V8D7_THECX|nr:PAS domain S-box protein [Thermasporomyces composti]REF37556.1 PAS domain S-box-containing protein [Thermasporomyces composti]